MRPVLVLRRVVRWQSLKYVGWDVLLWLCLLSERDVDAVERHGRALRLSGARFRASQPVTLVLLPFTPTMSLYLYDLPRELLDTLTVRGGPSEDASAPEPAPEPARTTQTSAATGRSCGVCQGATFVDLDDQRAHFRSDWHRYNVKARLANGKTVTEQEFATLVDGAHVVTSDAMPCLNAHCRPRPVNIRLRVLRRRVQRPRRRTRSHRTRIARSDASALSRRHCTHQASNRYQMVPLATINADWRL